MWINRTIDQLMDSVKKLLNTDSVDSPSDLRVEPVGLLLNVNAEEMDFLSNNEWMRTGTWGIPENDLSGSLHEAQSD